MPGKIIAHIVGLPNIMKEQFINDFKTFKNNKNTLLVDLDNITMQIISDKDVVILYNKLDELNDKKKGNKQFQKTVNNAIKDIESKINDFWKSKIDNFLLKEINKNKNIICIGMSTYFKNHKIGIKIITPNKLFIKLNLFENARCIIEENLDIHRDEIINGSFDLNYLDVNYLVRRREDLQDIYNKMGYQLKSYNDICKISQLAMQEVIPDSLYFVDYNEISKKDIKKKKNITAYTSEWLAIVSILKNKITKGYQNKKPYIQELVLNGFEELNEPLYLYYTTDVESFMPEITNSNQIYKYTMTKPINKFTCVEMKNPLEKLIKLKIKMINYKK
jgi:hypothetical protein